MKRRQGSAERAGKEKDPVFGDDAIWIKFENVRIRK